MQLSAGRHLMVRCRLPAVSGIRSLDVGRRFRTFASSASSIVQERAPIAGYDWDSLGFALNTKETEMVVVEGTADGWSEAKVMPYAPLSVEPSAVALNYGQALFEGVKAYRTTDDRLVVFRPVENARRMREGGNRYALADFSEEMFIDAIDKFVSANARWVLPQERGPVHPTSANGLGAPARRSTICNDHSGRLWQSCGRLL